MTDITVKELDELHRKLFDTKLEYEASKAATSTIYDDYKKLQEEKAELAEQKKDLKAQVLKEIGAKINA